MEGYSVRCISSKSESKSWAKLTYLIYLHLYVWMCLCKMKFSDSESKQSLLIGKNLQHLTDMFIAHARPWCYLHTVIISWMRITILQTSGYMQSRAVKWAEQDIKFFRFRSKHKPKIKPFSSTMSFSFDFGSVSLRFIVVVIAGAAAAIFVTLIELLFMS